MNRAFAADFDTLTEKALANGTSPEMMNFMLVSLTNTLAIKSGPQAYFDHLLWTQAEGKRLLEEFEARYGDKIDIDELAKGNLVAKNA